MGSINSKSFFFLLVIICTKVYSQKNDSTIIKGTVLSRSISITDSFFIKLISNKVLIESKNVFGNSYDFIFSVRVGKTYSIIINDQFGNNWTSYPIEAKATSIVDLNTIKLSNLVKVLDEVVVSSSRKYITERPDKIIYDVANDPDCKNITLIEVLRKIPVINITGDDEIDINGKGYKVFVNGRKTALFARNVQQVLRSFPANLIKNIEVISNPGAKYDANFSGSIINVVLLKKTLEGYNFSIDPSFNTLGNQALSASLTTKFKKLGFSGYYNPNFISSPESFSINNSYNNSISNKNNYFTSDIFQNQATSFVTNNEFSYQFDSLNLLSISISTAKGKSLRHLKNKSILSDQFYAIIESFNIDNTISINSKNPEMAIDYQRGFKNNDERLLTLSYRSERSDDLVKTAQQVSGIINYPSGINSLSNQEINKEKTLQLDYTTFIFKQLFETGFKYINRDGSSFTSNILYTSPTTNNLVQAQNLLFKQSVSSGYFSTQIGIGKIALNYGLRIELTQNVIDNINKTQYLNVLPSIAGLLKLSKKTSIKLSYSRKIERPDFSYLNPFVDISNNRFWQFGNPDLVISTIDNIELGLTFIQPKTSHRMNLGFQNSLNRVESFQYLDIDSIFKRTYLNLGNFRSFNINYSFLLKYNKYFSHNLKLSGSFREFYIENTKTNSAFLHNGSYNLSYRSKKNFQTSFDFGYLSSIPTLQGSIEGRVTNTITFSKRFSNNKFYVALRFRNMFPEFLTRRTEINDNNFKQYIDNTILQRSIQINLSFNITKLKEDIKRIEKSIENDDRKKVDKKKE